MLLSMYITTDITVNYTHHIQTIMMLVALYMILIKQRIAI